MRCKTRPLERAAETPPCRPERHRRCCLFIKQPTLSWAWAKPRPGTPSTWTALFDRTHGHGSVEAGLAQHPADPTPRRARLPLRELAGREHVVDELHVRARAVRQPDPPPLSVGDVVEHLFPDRDLCF